MVYNEHSIHIDAPPDQVWSVLVDIERWPGWAPHVSRADRLENTDFGLRSTARLEIAGAPKSVWTVTEFEDGKAFAWSSKTRGVRSDANHLLEPEGGGTRATLSVANNGLIATLLSPFITSVARRNLTAEAEGLKRRCESIAE